MEDGKKYRIFIIEDHAAIRSAYRRLIEREWDMEICGEVDSGEKGLEAIRLAEPDVVILDLKLPGISGIQLVESLLQLQSDLQILVVSGQDKYVYAPASLEAGAQGYLDKACSARHLTKAIREVANGNRYLDKELKERGRY